MSPVNVANKNRPASGKVSAPSLDFAVPDPVQPAFNMLSGVRVMSHTTTERDEPMPIAGIHGTGMNRMEMGVVKKNKDEDEVASDDANGF